MYQINRLFFSMIQSILLINITKQSKIKQSTIAFKAISNTIKNPTIKKIFSSLKKSMNIVGDKKNSIKHLACGLQQKCLRNRNIFESRHIKYLKESYNFRSISVKSFEEKIKFFRNIAPQAIRGSKRLVRTECKKNIWMKSISIIDRKRVDLRSLANMVHKSKPYLPFLFAAGGLNRLTQINLQPIYGDYYELNQKEMQDKNKDNLNKTHKQLKDEGNEMSEAEQENQKELNAGRWKYLKRSAAPPEDLIKQTKYFRDEETKAYGPGEAEEDLDKHFVKKSFDKPYYYNKCTKLEKEETSKPKFLQEGRTYSKYENNQLFLGDGKWKKDVIKLANWNINGIRAVQRKGELKNYIENNKPDALILNEVRIDEKSFEIYKFNVDIPKEYHQYWSFCTIKKGYSGVCLFSKVKPISIKEGMGILKHDMEGRLITAEYEKFFLVGAYVPNSGSFIWDGSLKRLSYRTKEWDVDFLTYLNKLKQTKPVVMCGDQNVVHKDIDIYNPAGKYKWAGMTYQEREGMDYLIKSNWVDTYRDLYPQKKQYSWWNYGYGRANNEGWRIDYFMTDRNAMDAVKDSRILDQQLGSDHCPVEMDLEVKKLPKYSN